MFITRVIWFIDGNHFIDASDVALVIYPETFTRCSSQWKHLLIPILRKCQINWNLLYAEYSHYTKMIFSLSLYLCGIVLYLSVVVSCFFIHFAHSSTRKECIFIVFINHAHDIGSLIFRLTFSYAMLAIDQTSPKTKLIRIVCERHSRFGNLSHIFFCCSLSLSLFSNLNSVPKMLAAWYFVQLLVQCENKMLLHGKAKWSHVVHSNQIFYTC